MPISPFLDRNIEFDTETKRVMGVPFEMTRVSLGLADDLANGIIAKPIIDLALKLISECGTDLSAWPSAKHFTSCLSLAPGNKISGGKILSSRTRPSGNRAAALLRLAATTVGRTETALGAFYRRLSARIGKAKAVTATARKIAVLFYNAVRHGMDYADPGASYYEERYRQRVLTNLQRRAKALGYVLQPTEIKVVSMAVS